MIFSQDVVAFLINHAYVYFLLRSLQRALDRRLYLLLYGSTYGDPTGNTAWHFPEKVYEPEETTLRKVGFL